MTDPLGGVTRSGYGLAGQLLAQTSPAGYFIARRFGAGGDESPA